MKRFLTFPNPVNDAAARLVPLTYGFVARVLAGPKISPLGQFAVRVSGPRLTKWKKDVPGPPKRFAQGIGAVLTISATIVWLSVGWTSARWILVPLLGAASLEGFFGYCLGCTMFAWLIRAHLVPESVCVECGDLSARYAAAGYPPA